VVSVKIFYHSAEISGTTDALLAQFRFSDVPFPKTVEQWLYALTTPFSITLFAIGFFGLFIGWLLGRSARKEREDEKMSSPVLNRESDLEWRHEKLVLLERQEADLHDRVQDLVASLPESDAAIGSELKCKLFGLAEQMRELRQRVGSDLSRLEVVRDRLVEMCGQDIPRKEAVTMCEEMASAQSIRLEEMREQLREPTRSLGAIAEDFDPSAEFTEATRDQLVEKLSECQDPIRELPVDLAGMTDETDERIRELLKAGEEPEFESLWKVLLVDGAVTTSRKPSEITPWQQLRSLLDRLRQWEPAKEDSEAESATDSANQYRLSLPITPLSPDQGFKPPISTAISGNGNGNGNGIHSEPEESKVEETVTPEEGQQIVFRSNRPEDWGQTLYRGANRRAREIAEVPEWAEWISLERTDTGERVIVPIASYLASSDDVSASFGFNASREKFYGAHHLGVFADSCPNEVETRFTYGGWGFGHRVTELGEGRADPQASGWAGKEISVDTVFEVALLAELPELTDQDVLLGGEVASETASLSSSREV